VAMERTTDRKEGYFMKVPEPRKLPSGTWFLQMRLNGVSVPVSAESSKECKHTAELIKAEYGAGKRQIQKNKATPTLRQAIDAYISVRSNTISPSTIRGYEIIRDNRFQSVMDKKLNDIKDWQKLCNSESKNLSAKSIKNSWYLMASILKESGVEVPNIKMPQVVSKERLYLEPEQIPIFVKSVKGEKCEIAALLALSSLRCSEICSLKWENIDLKNRRILVSGAMVQGQKNKFVDKPTNKSKSSRRYVPILMNELYTALSDCEAKEGIVVTQRPNTIFRQINKVCESSGLPLVGVHGLRHSFASLAYHLQMPEKIAMQIGGWADRETMSEIYTHLSQKDVSKYADEMKQFYNNANENANKDKKSCIYNAYET